MQSRRSLFHVTSDHEKAIHFANELKKIGYTPEIIITKEGQRGKKKITYNVYGCLFAIRGFDKGSKQNVEKASKKRVSAYQWDEADE